MSTKPPKQQYPHTLIKRINDSITQITKLQSYDSYRLRPILKNIICSQEFDNWLALKQVLQSEHIKTTPQLYGSILNALQSVAMERQQSYIMLAFLYGWIKETKTRISMFGLNRLLKQFANQGKISMLTSWLSEADCQSLNVAQTLTMLCRYYPLLIAQENLTVQVHQLQLLIQLICHADLRTIQQFEDFDKLFKVIRLFRLGSMKFESQLREYDTNKQEHVIIKTTLDILANTKNCTGSASWLFIPPSLIKSDIRTFTSYNAQQLLLYTQNQLINIFSKLFQSSLQQNALVLFFQFSKIFRQAEKYYELKILYQKIVLPIIARRGKAKVNLTELVLDVSAFYVIGFYEHCDIGFNGMTCLLNNVDKIDEKDVKLKWIELAFLLADKSRKLYEQIIFEELLKYGFKKQELITIDRQRNFGRFGDTNIWQITVRNARKLKTYSKTISKSFKGIQNHSLQCYIISVMQALFTTKQLSRILKQFPRPPRTSLIYHIKELFTNLQNKYTTSVSVDDVKRNGPQFFAQSEGQQDAQQYLLKVFEMIEDQLTRSKEQLLLNAFNKAFKSKITRKLECQNCQNIINKDEEQFIHTIPNRISLRQKQVQQINDYTCQKCKSKKIMNKIQLHPTSTIFIVHFNRFSFQNQKSQKQLVTQNIKREFMGYRLRGIVFHIGKNVQFGHYVYYFCCGGKKWMEMNDSSVMEFQLEHQDQEFEREMKAQMTPYILFYVKK